MQSKYKYYIVVDGVRTQIDPQGVQQLQTSFDLNRDGRFSHDVSVVNQIILTGADYKFYYALETSNNRCGDIMIEIEKWCGNAYVSFLSGYLRPIDGYYDLDKCRLEMEITAVDPYYCYEYNKKREIDVFEAKPYNDRVKAHVVQGEIEVYIKEYADNQPFDPYNPGGFFGGTDPRMAGWLIFRNESWIFGPNSPRGDGAQKNQFKTYYAREILEIPSTDPDPGPGWIFISDVGGTKKYARQVVRTNYRRLLPNNYDPEGDIQPTTIRHFSEMEEDSLLYAYDVMGYEDTPDAFDNGILLTDLLGYFINKFCGISIKSTFFQVNADETFSEGYEQLPDDARTLHNIIFQKSDVKRLNASNNATKGITTLEKLLNSILTVYNLEYRIENGFFRIEHVSYWNRVVGLDLTTPQYADYMRGSNKYKYDKSKLPQFEEFAFMEAGNDDFKGKPIEYFGRCFSIEEGENIKRRDAQNITTDVEFCMLHSGGDDDTVSDDGFVIMATVLDGEQYFIMRFNPILDPYSRVNNPLSWAHLQEAFYQHARPQKIGYMNNVFHEFHSTIPVKKQDKVIVPFCCGDELKLVDFVKTGLGDGIIEKAVLNHYRETLELDLLYENQYQEAFCTPLTRFSLNRVTTDRFYFDVGFLDCTVNHTMQVEVTLPNGTVYLTEPITTICNGVVDIPLTGEEATYKFRARQICEDAISQWSDYVSVDYVDPVSCPALPVVSFVNRTQPNIFVFQFTEAAFANAVDIEHTLPSGSTSIRNNVTIEQVGSNVKVTYNITNSNQVQQIFPGLYKFRFRRRCGTVTTSLFGNYVNVTVS
ncbi:MAG: hypothetical protein ACTHLE_04145 [Agriterribacter sp.]